MSGFSRRGFLKATAGGTLLLAGSGFVAGCGSGSTLAPDMKVLTRNALEALQTLVPAILDGALPEDQAARAVGVNDAIEAFDRAVAGLHPDVQAEIGQLFSLLAIGPARWLIGGSTASLAGMTPEAAKAFLAHWRGSSINLLFAGYNALTQLVQAAWYGNPLAWGRIGYSGPPQVPA